MIVWENDGRQLSEFSLLLLYEHSIVLITNKKQLAPAYMKTMEDDILLRGNTGNSMLQ